MGPKGTSGVGFYRLEALSGAHPTVSKHRGKLSSLMPTMEPTTHCTSSFIGPSTDSCWT